MVIRDVTVNLRTDDGNNMPFFMTMKEWCAMVNSFQLTYHMLSASPDDVREVQIIKSLSIGLRMTIDHDEFVTLLERLESWGRDRGIASDL